MGGSPRVSVQSSPPGSLPLPLPRIQPLLAGVPGRDQEWGRGQQGIPVPPLIPGVRPQEPALPQSLPALPSGRGAAGSSGHWPVSERHLVCLLDTSAGSLTVLGEPGELMGNTLEVQ